MSLKKLLYVFVSFVMLAGCAAPAPAAAPAAAVAPAAADASGKWCTGMTIRYFVGGNAGTPFAKVVDTGAHAAAAAGATAAAGAAAGAGAAQPANITKLTKTYSNFFKLMRLLLI